MTLHKPEEIALRNYNRRMRKERLERLVHGRLGRVLIFPVTMVKSFWRLLKLIWHEA